jgi:chromosome partitioning protein
MSCIAVFNQKGGVGKTTTSLNLAAALYRSGRTPLLIDMDPQAHLSEIHSRKPLDKKKSLFGLYDSFTPIAELAIDWHGIGRLVPSHRELGAVETRFGKGPFVVNRLRLGLESFLRASPGTDIIIDCSPTVGALSIGAIFAADLILIPVSSDYLSLQAAKKVEKTLKALEVVLKQRVPRRYLLTRFDRRRGMSLNVKLEAAMSFGEDVLHTMIPVDVELAKSPSLQQHIFQLNTSSKGAKSYETLASELIEANLLGENSSP